MRKLSVGQQKITAEILGNIAVAWFAAGVIGPLFASSLEFSNFLVGLVVSLVMALAFGAGALEVVRKVKI
jgi:uncharacterized membrane protein YgaE (UPF0421/DUF939 family)